MTAFGVHFGYVMKGRLERAQSTKLKLYFAFIPSKNQNNENNE